MEKMLAEHSKKTASLCNNVIEPRYSPACVKAEPRMSQMPSLEVPLGRREPAANRLPVEQESGVLCVHRMSEFAKRIEESAASSSVWIRLGGDELLALRLSFRNLLRQLLNELDAGANASSQEYESICRSSKNGDIILAYRFASLLSTAVALSPASSAMRVEVGFRSGATEFSCFLADRSAGIAIRRNDNLFALCTNGEWRDASSVGVPSLAAIGETVAKLGGQLSMDAMEGAVVKVSFSV